MNYVSEKSKGSALIYAIVIMAIVGTISLGVAQISLRKTQSFAQVVDGIQAYYLSESAVEIGFTARNIKRKSWANIVPFGSQIADKAVLRAMLADDFSNNILNFRQENDPDLRKIGPNDRTLEFRVYPSGGNFILQSKGYFGQSSVPLSARIGSAGSTVLPIYFTP